MLLADDKGSRAIRENVWLTAWVHVASANDCKEPAAATKWADICLQRFDERFPKHAAKAAADAIATPPTP